MNREHQPNQTKLNRNEQNRVEPSREQNRAFKRTLQASIKVYCVAHIRFTHKQFFISSSLAGIVLFSTCISACKWL